MGCTTQASVSGGDLLLWNTSPARCRPYGGSGDRNVGGRDAPGGRGDFGKGNQGGSWGHGGGATYLAKPRKEDVMDYTKLFPEMILTGREEHKRD